MSTIKPDGRPLIHIIDRSNLDEIVAIRPADGENPREEFTRAQQLARHSYHRADVVLVNCTRTGAEYTLYVTKNGYSGDMWILDILTDEEYEELERIAHKMRRNAIEYPPAAKLLR